MNEKLSVIREKLKGVKNIKLVLAILAVAAAILIYLAISNGLSINQQTQTIKTESQNLTVKYSETEEKLADILEQIDGVEKAKVLITYDNEKNINGVVVVAAGAENPVAEWKIRHAIQTAMKIDYHSIEVFSMK